MSDSSRDFHLLLRPESVALLFLDHQDNLLAALSLQVRDSLTSNTLALARIAKICSVPIVISSLTSDSLRGRTRPQLRKLFSKVPELTRSEINCWDDQGLADAVGALQKERLLLAGLWTETAITFAALSAVELGYEVFVVTDATAGTSAEAHDMAIQRMVQASVVPVTWRQVLFEWYRAAGSGGGAVASALMDIAKQYGYPLGGASSEADPIGS